MNTHGTPLARRVALLLIALGSGILLVGLLLYSGLRPAGKPSAPSTDAGPSNAVVAPLAAPSLASSSADAATRLPDASPQEDLSTTARADTAEAPGLPRDAAAVEESTVALVNGTPVPLAALEVALAADRAMGALLGAATDGDPAAALERLINGEVVLQAAQRDGFDVDEHTVDQALAALLAPARRTPEELDHALAGAGLAPEEFREYFGRLVRIDRYSQQQAQSRQMLASDYVQQLQETARISFGPAAAEALGSIAEVARLDGGGDSASPAVARPAAAANGQPVNSPESEPEQPPSTLAVAGREEAGAASAIDVATVRPGPRGTAIGDYAPLFDLPALNPAPADNLSLDGLLGSPALLSFWTTWCPYCQRQTPVLASAYLADTSQGIQFVGIDVAEQPGLVREYVANQGVPYPIALDEDGEVADRYGVLGYPTTFFLDGEGRVVAQHVGALSAEELAVYLQQLR